MRMRLGILWLAFLVTPLGLAQNEVDEVVARHIQAHGGLEAWKAVKSIKLTGNFTGFSITKPFTMVRTSQGKLRFDHSWGEKDVIIGSTPEKSWWINHMLGKIPVDAPVWAVPQMREWADLVSPFFDWRERGYSLQYLGRTELDGQWLLALKLTREAGRVETWYLDPESYLAVARVSQGSDFGDPKTQTTFFDDFRVLNGLKIPFIEETTFGTRHRLMEVQKVELNVPVDESLFLKPYPEAMKRLEDLVGEWEIQGTVRDAPNLPWLDFQGSAVIENMLDGNLFLERFNVVGSAVAPEVRAWSHDQYRDHYTIVATSKDTGLADVLQGSWKDGVLSADNLAAGTSWTDGQTTYNRRLRLTDLNDDNFVVEEDQSMDGGTRWFNRTKITYKRKRQ